MFLAVPAPAQTKLEWKFAPGQVFEVERTAAQKLSVEAKEKSFKLDRQSSWHVRLEVKEPHARGFLILALLTKVEQRLDGVAPSDMLDRKVIANMQGASVTLLVAPDGRLLELQGHDAFIRRLAGDDKKLLDSVRTQFGESTMKETFADMFGPLPDKKVSMGDAWEHTTLEAIPHFGSLRVKKRCVYEGKAKDLERIACTTQTTFELPAAERIVLFRVVKGSIEKEKTKEFLTFDSAAGHLVVHDRSTDLRGSLTIETMDRQHPFDFTSASEVKIRVKIKK
jgi:hypothetical protein